MLFKGAGRAQIIIMGANFVTSHNPKTGAEFWRYDYNPDKGLRQRNISSIVPSADMLYGVKSRGELVFAIKPPHAQTETAPEPVWTFGGPAPDSSTPLYYKGNVYVLDSQLSQVVVEVSVLTRPEELKVKEPGEYLKRIKVGKHGLIIRKWQLSGLLLPQVAVEHKMDAREFLQQTCIKASLPTYAWEDEDTSIYTFESFIAHENKPPKKIETC